MTVSLSPIYAHFSETLNGLSTIRALRATQRFSEDNKQKLELNQRTNFTGTAILLSGFYTAYHTLLFNACLLSILLLLLLFH